MFSDYVYFAITQGLMIWGNKRYTCDTWRDWFYSILNLFLGEFRQLLTEYIFKKFWHFFKPKFYFIKKEAANDGNGDHDRSVVTMVAGNSFLWQEVSFCDKKFLLMPRNFFPWKDISTSDKKFLPMTRNIFLWQEISSCDKKFLPVTRNFFL